MNFLTEENMYLKMQMLFSFWDKLLPKACGSEWRSVRARDLKTHLKWEAVEMLPYAVALGCEVLMSSEMWDGAGHKACLQPRISKLF